jgi:hypothetical protein
MAAITTRAGKGSPLTHAEVDANFTNLNTELGGKAVPSDISTAITNHEALSNPHPIYLTQAEGDALYLGLSAQAATVATISGRISAGTNVTITGLGTAASPFVINASSGGVTDGDKGDITVSSGGTVWTIDNNAVTNADLAQVASGTFKGRVTAATGNVEDFTGTQATTLLDVFTTTLKGLVPGSGGGTTNFLRADGTWAAPPGGGGGVSDGDKGDITVSGSGATWTIDNGVVTLAKMADMATASLIYRKTAGTGAPEVQTLATLKTDLGLTGTNSGDQTITLTGDVTGSGTGSFAATLTTVNSNVGSFGSSTLVPVITVNAKGLITAISTVAVSGGSGSFDWGKVTVGRSAFITL